MIKSFFKTNGMDYVDYDISKNMEKRKEMIEKTGQMGIPVIDIEGEIVIGYNEPKIRELLGIKG